MSAITQAADMAGHNQVHEVRFRGGLIGLFAGESQQKALTKSVADINLQGRVVAGLVNDRWSFWRRLGWAFIFVFTLGIYTRQPNVLLVSAPASAATPATAPPAAISAPTPTALPPVVDEDAAALPVPSKATPRKRATKAPTKKATPRRSRT